MTHDTVVILTGASRGLGHGIARRYLEQGAHVLGLSRRPAGDLEGLGASHGAKLEQWTADLADPLPVGERLAAWLVGMAQAPRRVRLIHNAALLPSPGLLAETDPAELSASLRVGLEAPIVLTAVFLKATSSWAASDRRVLFVSSGLGRRAMAGSAAYCAQKAGLDHLARALALDEAQHPHGARVASVAPGIIDTDMQRQLRGADPASFPERATFAQWHATGALSSPAQAAERLVARLERDDYGQEPVTDVRE